LAVRYLLPLFALTLSAQTPTFEVASIRPVAGRGPGVAICGLSPSPQAVVSGPEGKLVSGTRELFALIWDAHKDLADTEDLPQWVYDAGTFAISVKIPPNTDARTCRAMLRNLLAERFHLVVALEPRDVGRYHLKVDKSGFKMKSADGPPPDPNTDFSSQLQGLTYRETFRGASIASVIYILENPAMSDARARGYTTSSSFSFAAGLVDDTGLTGYYDGSIQLQMKPPAPDELTESLDDALRNYLGLTLELRKTPGKVLVIRSGDRVPTEN
jgi:uncharacterized protein (TIGR03435 family)